MRIFAFTVRHVGLYSFAQETEYVTPCTTIGFTVSGQVYHECLGKRWEGGEPCFHFTPGGVTTRFAHARTRRDYAIRIETDAVRPGREPGTILLATGIDTISLPALVPVPRERVPGWEEELSRLQQASPSPTPRNVLRVETGVINIFRWALDRHADRLAAPPAQEYQRLLDEDTRQQYSLRELADRCGYRVDHLQELFQQAFGITPQACRQQRRLVALAMELVANSRLSVKEIADAARFIHAAHFSNQFRKAFGIAPGVAVRRFRHQA